jgi:bifunctional DNase/RNase
VVELDGRTVNIDSRPSDALAVAVRTHVPIMVNRSVMDTAGIIPEEDMQEEGEEISDAPEAGSERLSVFEDFLENLETDPDDEDNDGGEDAD